MTRSFADKDRQTLVNAYENLPQLEKEVINLLSVIYGLVNRKLLIECMTALDLHDELGKPFVYKTLRPIITRLQKHELVEVLPRGIVCNRSFAEILSRRLAAEDRFERFAEIVQDYIPIQDNWGEIWFETKDQLYRQMRIGLYRGKRDYIHHQLEAWRRGYYNQKASLEQFYQQVCDNPFDQKWLLQLPADIFADIMGHRLAFTYHEMISAPHYLIALKIYLAQRHEQTTSFADDWQALQLLFAELCILHGEITDAKNALAEAFRISESPDALALQGWTEFLEGRNDDAIALYSQALISLKKTTRRRKIYFRQLSGLFFILALLKTDDPVRLQEAIKYIDSMHGHRLGPSYRCIKQVILMQQGRRDALEQLRHLSEHFDNDNGITTLICALCVFWRDAKSAKVLLQSLKDFHQRATQCGFSWIAAETAELLSRLGAEPRFLEQARTFHDAQGTQRLVDTITPRQPWEVSLNALLKLNRSDDARPSVARRLAWFISYRNGDVHLQPREQKLTASGAWTKGRAVALKRLTDADKINYLTPHDIKICNHIKAYSYGYYGQMQYLFEERTILDLVGHPLVFWEDARNERVDIVQGKPELLVKRDKNQELMLDLYPKPDPDRDFLVVRDGPARLRVIHISEEHQRIFSILGTKGLKVPEHAKDQVLDAITNLSSLITVHSDIGGGTTSAEPVPSDPRPHLNLRPLEEGLKVSLLTQPFTCGGPYCRPGTGGETIIAEVDGKLLQTERRLLEERTLANKVINTCPSLGRGHETDGEWALADPQDCLELLLELQNLGDEVIVTWPEGERFKISRQVTTQRLQINIKRGRDWFEMDGKLRLDEDLVLDMQRLLALVQATPSRFLPLGDGEYLALTQEFRQRLDELNSFSEKYGEGVRFHPLAAPALVELTEEAGDLATDSHWEDHLKRIQEMEQLRPEPPSTLQAELRDYQLQGFAWLARLAHWGVGACLADDMGLGKTLQALALILTRVQQGPSLVIAPTSVCINWMSEVRRFAPTLNAIQFGAGERRRQLEALGAYDLLVCSYGLLQQEQAAELLAEPRWQVIVLDEAQAIKNMATKRSQAAMKLQGEFKLITTGTPIENHLGELWNLFRFINPGLLGSLESFNRRFALPIERDQDRGARNKLKRLIRPFILRRNKNQVLEELPSRTEVLMHVDLSEEELAFYEALRQQALRSLNDSKAPAGQRHMLILAEIMRLRRACCNTRLVMADSALPSAKLQVFGELVEELLENRHKALVFSQFVDHLSIIRNDLRDKGISHQYLDGSTPARERGRRVEAFQAGQGDIFLISLKAGGLGLNLTAADYVIHMDPWWNPAVEDQASDRVHRIGQQRPVTIYRLVAKNTIEDKIVDLHQHKRDLADSLLEGSDMSGKISAEELLRLIGGQ
jgi:superfamily II DNA or RNA helicase